MSVELVLLDLLLTSTRPDRVSINAHIESGRSPYCLSVSDANGWQRTYRISSSRSNLNPGLPNPGSVSRTSMR